MGFVARRPGGFDDAQGPLGSDAMALEALFAAYDRACAFTGQPLGVEARVEPRGYLLNLSDNPLTTDPTLLIPATLDAIFAVERGHLAIGPRYNLLVDLERIDPELAERLNPIGRLRLPEDSALRPSLGAMTPHLIAFATGRRQR